MKEKRDVSVFVVPVFFTTVALYVIYEMQFKNVPKSDAAFPTVAAVVMLLGAIPTWIQAIKGTMSHEKIDLFALLRIIFLAAVLYLYVFFLKSVGYLICTFLLCVIVLFSLGYEKKLIAVLYSAVMTGTVYILFKILLHVPLSAGVFALM